MNFLNDPDFLDLISAWCENKSFSPTRRQQLLNRLNQDSDLRKALAHEIEMAGLTRAVQSGEPRWLDLEEKLGLPPENKNDFENQVWEEIASKPLQPENKVISFSKFAGFGIAAAFVLALFLNKPESTHNQVAKFIRVEGPLAESREWKSLEKGEEFKLAEGMVELAFKDTGVHLIGTGPLDMTLVDKNRLFLREGQIKLVVPPQGIGFVVDTMERKFVDLGTSFVVQASNRGSRVLVLDGEIAVGDPNSKQSMLMRKGGLADFDRNGKISPQSTKPSGVPDTDIDASPKGPKSLLGKLLAFPEAGTSTPGANDVKAISRFFLPLIQSQFQDQQSVSSMKQGPPLRFRGIAGTYDQFPQRYNLSPFSEQHGWMAWFQGKVSPPQKGKFRFWGYADNNLLVSINGKPVFEGSRYDSHFRTELKVPRNNHPALPCLNARAGFASGEWFEVDTSPVKIDILFGESQGHFTSSVLLIEQEGMEYESTYWGQPKWPIFATEGFNRNETSRLRNLQAHMEEKLMGSFSIPEEELWAVVE